MAEHVSPPAPPVEARYLLPLLLLRQGGDFELVGKREEILDGSFQGEVVLFGDNLGAFILSRIAQPSPGSSVERRDRMRKQLRRLRGEVEEHLVHPLLSATLGAPVEG